MKGFEMRDKRQCVGLTQREVAASMGVNQGQVSRWEKGVDPISTEWHNEFMLLMLDKKTVALIKINRKRTRRDRIGGRHGQTGF